MKRYCAYAAAAIFAFAIGVGANSMINYVGDKIIDQSDHVCNVTRAMWNEPILEPPRVPSCGQLVVGVDSYRRLYLNRKLMGSLEDPDELLDWLHTIFRVREELHVYRAGVSATSDIPENERIDKSVFVKADRTLNHGDVLDLIERLARAGATPILDWPDDYWDSFQTLPTD